MRVPRPGPQIPRRGNAFTRAVGRAVLRVLRFRIAGDLPDLPKWVAIAAPHSSNWDFVIGIAAAFAIGVRVDWIGKHTLFRRPFGPTMRWLGGTPVERHATRGRVEETAALVRSRDRIVLALAPEGTRRRVERWRTGFYWIARGAGVPIVPCYLDYARREVGIGPVFRPTGSLERDLEEIRAFYADKTPRHPERFGPRA